MSAPSPVFPGSLRVVALRARRKVPKIGIGGSLATPPFPREVTLLLAADEVIE